MKIINEGAEAKIFLTNAFGERMLIKHRFEKRYKIKEIDTEFRELRTKKEAKIMEMLRRIGVNSPEIFAAGRYSIYMSIIDGKLLKDSKVPIPFYEKIGVQLATMHNNDIAHGDFTPANIIVSHNKAVVIDFGLADVTKSIEDKAIDLLLMKRSISKKAYLSFLRAYAQNSKDSKIIVKRLADIEKRGRYQIRTLA